MTIHWGVVLIIFSIYLFLRMVVMPTLKYMMEKTRSSVLVENMKDTLEKSREETDLLQSNTMPTDEHILLYYKMYLKKFERDHRDEWTTYENNPMSFGEWEGRAKDSIDSVGGYHFIISRTMDITFIGGMGGGSMMRHTDYRKLVEYDETDSV